jgi:hypothetical protein
MGRALGVRLPPGLWNRQRAIKFNVDAARKHGRTGWIRTGRPCWSRG